MVRWFARLRHSKKVLGSVLGRGGPFCVECARSPRVCVGFLLVLWFPPQSEYMYRGFISSQWPRPNSLMKIWIWSAPQVAQTQRTNFTVRYIYVTVLGVIFLLSQRIFFFVFLLFFLCLFFFLHFLFLFTFRRANLLQNTGSYIFNTMQQNHFCLVVRLKLQHFPNLHLQVIPSRHRQDIQHSAELQVTSEVNIRWRVSSNSYASL